MDWGVIVSKKQWLQIKTLDNVVNSDTDFFVRSHQTRFDSMWSPNCPVSSMEPLDMITFWNREKRWWFAQLDFYKKIKFRSVFYTGKGFSNNWSFFKEYCCSNLYTSSLIGVVSMLVFTLAFATLPTPDEAFNIFSLWLYTLYATIGILLLTLILIWILSRSFVFTIKYFFGTMIYACTIWCMLYLFVVRWFIGNKRKVSYYISSKKWHRIGFVDFFKFNVYRLFLVFFLLSLGLFFTIGSFYINFGFHGLSLGVFFLIQCFPIVVIILATLLSNILVGKKDTFQYHPLFDYKKYRNMYEIPEPINLPYEE